MEDTELFVVLPELGMMTKMAAAGVLLEKHLSKKKIDSHENNSKTVGKSHSSRV